MSLDPLVIARGKLEAIWLECRATGFVGRGKGRLTGENFILCRNDEIVVVYAIGEHLYVMGSGELALRVRDVLGLAR